MIQNFYTGNIYDRLRAQNDYTDLSIDHLVKKARRFKRRANTHKKKQGQNGVRRTHKANLTGQYHDENGKLPKFYHNQKPIQPINTIGSYGDMLEAVLSIQSGNKKWDQYSGVTGINRDRLRIAQSWTDRDKPYSVQDIMRLTRAQIIEDFRERKHVFGLQYNH